MTQDSDHFDRLAEIRARVRADGRRWTVAKCAIVEALLAGSGHLSPREIHATVLIRHPQIDQSTVYRALQTLAEARVVHALDRRGEARYGLTDRPHHHAVCAGCGRDAEIPAATAHGLLAEAESTTGFRFGAESLTLLGHCAACDRPDR